MTRRTWEHARWHPWGVGQLSCGCWWDVIAGRMWEPCMTHEGDGHLAAISTDQDGGVVVARCLVLTCGWQASLARENWAVQAAQEHWQETRERGHASAGSGV
jgi:hypothetical protein